MGDDLQMRIESSSAAGEVAGRRRSCRRWIQKTIFFSVVSIKNFSCERISAARLRKPVASSTCFELFQIAFEALQRVQRGEIEVAALLQEALAIGEGHAPASGAIRG